MVMVMVIGDCGDSMWSVEAGIRHKHDSGDQLGRCGVSVKFIVFMLIFWLILIICPT